MAEGKKETKLESTTVEAEVVTAEPQTTEGAAASSTGTQSTTDNVKTKTTSQVSTGEYSPELSYIGLGSGILAFVMFCAGFIVPFVSCLGFIFAVVAIVIGFIQRKKAKAAGLKTTIDDASIGLGVAFFVISICILCLSVFAGAAFLATVPGLAEMSDVSTTYSY